MCTLCGLPTTHSNLAQVLGVLTLVSGITTTFLGAWIVVRSAQVRHLLSTLARKFPSSRK